MRERLLSLSFYLCAAMVSAQAPYVFQHAFNGIAEEDSKFGWSMAASDDWVAIGIPFSGPGADANGAVALHATAQIAAGIYTPVQVVQENISPVSDQKFGVTLACSNTLLAVSNCSKRHAETYCNDAAEWVSIFQWNGSTWQQLQQLQRPPWATGGTYGRALAISDDVLAVGGTRSLNGTVTRDVVYLYKFQNGGFTSLPTDSVDGSPLNTSAADDLGHALAMEGSTLLVGATGDSELGAAAGAVYVYDKDLGGADQWGLVRKLLASNGRAADRFGFDVAVSGTRAAVGAPGRMQNGITVGMAYVFDRDHGFGGNWGQVDSLAPLLPEGGRVFGAAVAIRGDRVAIGAPPPTLGDSSGIAEVFAPDAGGWTRVQRIDPFGEGHVYSINRAANCLAFSGNSVLIGAPWASITASPSDITGGVLRYTQDVVGIDEPSGRVLRLWPVPFSELLHVELPNAVQGPLTLELRDVSGRVVRSERVNTTSNVITIARVAIAPGHYILRVANASGELVSGPHRVMAQ